jgi:hypothetical protein
LVYWTELVKDINTIDKVRVLYGDAGEQDNNGENFAIYKNEFVYYSKGLSNDEVKKAVSSKMPFADHSSMPSCIPASS